MAATFSSGFIGTASRTASEMASKLTMPVALAKAPRMAVLTIGALLGPSLYLMAIELASTVATRYLAGRSKVVGC